MARASQLSLPDSSISSVLVVLGDSEDDEYPIYRTASPPDSAYTLVTAFFSYPTTSSIDDTNSLQLFMSNPYYTTEDGLDPTIKSWKVNLDSLWD